MNKKNWDKFAPIYNLFMKKDKKAYTQMYRKFVIQYSLKKFWSLQPELV